MILLVATTGPESEARVVVLDIDGNDAEDDAELAVEPDS